MEESTIKKDRKKNLTEKILVWGFPCVVIYFISLMVSVKVGREFGAYVVFEAAVFLTTFFLLLLSYIILFQLLPCTLLSIYLRVKELQETTVNDTNGGRCGES